MESSKRNLLEPVLIPKTMWGKNVRRVLSQQNWEALRWAMKATKEAAPYAKFIALNHLYFQRPSINQNYFCHYCKVPGDHFDLHELWDFNDQEKIQTLINLLPVCEDCHLALHLGYAYAMGLGERAMSHLSKTNSWTPDETLAAKRRIFQLYNYRSQFEYKLDQCFQGDLAVRCLSRRAVLTWVW